MKFIRLLFFGSMLLFSSASAQKLITLQSGINVSLHTTLDSAIAHANSGDHIYLPGGIITTGNLNVNKGVWIIGTGHYSDSSLATGITTLSGDVYLVNGSSGGLITGCNITGSIKVGSGSTGTDSVSNFTIASCSMDSLCFSFTGTPPTNARNFSINQNVIHGAISGANANNINVSKNIIEGSISYFNANSSLSNNDFIGLGNCTDLITLINNVSGVTFENNIFLFTPPACIGASLLDVASNNNVFTNNLFTMPAVFPMGTNTGFNSITNQPVDSVFINASGDLFSYFQNYNLRNNSPGNNAGTDSKDIGIYGTSQPYKKGALPFNPHIQEKTISPGTNLQGELNIQIKVAAQDY